MRVYFARWHAWLKLRVLWRCVRNDVLASQPITVLSWAPFDPWVMYATVPDYNSTSRRLARTAPLLAHSLCCEFTSCGDKAQKTCGSLLLSLSRSFLNRLLVITSDFGDCLVCGFSSQVKMVRVTMCQVAMATLFLCAAATILYSEHLWLQNRSIGERSAPVTAFSIPPTQTCNCTKEVSTAIKQAAAARATIAKNIEGTNDYPTNKRQIIVLSYGRSGSSFTADIVIQDPRTFFVFEPLYSAIRRYTGSDQIHDVSIVGNDKFAPKLNEKGELVNPEPYAIVGSPTYANYSVEATQILRFFLTCQLEYLKTDDLLNFMFLNRNNTIEFYKCFRDFPKNEAYFPKYLGCLWKLKEICLSKEIQVVKVIRFPARILRPLLEEFPKLKVLYLVRDPRGTLSSEMAILKTYEKTGIKEAAETFCGMVNDDAENIRLLSESYPDRIRTIRYETIARDAVSAARRMYDFLDLNFTPKIEGYIRKITAAKKDGHNFSTSRKDSWAAANKWRTISSYKNVRAVDSACEDVYDAVGFVKVPRESYLRDINTSLASRESLMENI